MARKSLKATKPDKNSDKVKIKLEHPTSAQIKSADQKTKALIEKGMKKGFLTYEEMNEELPEEAVTPRSPR